VNIITRLVALAEAQGRVVEAAKKTKGWLDPRNSVSGRQECDELIDALAALEKQP